jgi:general secretion pathway protein M
MFDKLETREKYLIQILIALFVVGAIYIIGNWFKAQRAVLSEQVVETRAQFVELDKLIKEYHYYKSLKSGQVESANEIITKLEQLLLKHSLKDNVSTMRDSKTIILKKYNKITIDINFNSVHLKNVFNIIYDIEVNKQLNVKVESLSFRKPLAGKEVYDVNIKLSAYSIKSGKDA